MAEYTTITEIERIGTEAASEMVIYDVTTDGSGSGTVTFDGSTNSGIANAKDTFTSVTVFSAQPSQALGTFADDAVVVIARENGTTLNQVDFTDYDSAGNTSSTATVVRLVIKGIR